MPESKKTDAQKSQLERFKETAKQVETDNSEESFDRALKLVGRPNRNPKVAGKAAK